MKRKWLQGDAVKDPRGEVKFGEDETKEREEKSQTTNTSENSQSRASWTTAAECFLLLHKSLFYGIVS